MSPSLERHRVLSELDDAGSLAQLRNTPDVTIIDLYEEQHGQLRELLPTVSSALLCEPCTWVWYPWRRALVRVLGRDGFRRLRLDRNRNKITEAETATLTAAAVGIVGLSVGNAVALALAMEGVGSLRLADFDSLETSNLNRVPGGLFDIGVNKTVVAARRIAELDPYIEVDCHPHGLTTAAQIDDFLNGLSLVVDECDSLDVKVLLRERASLAKLPVLMETSDRGTLDVERFDLETDREILHGLLHGIDSTALSGLSSAEKAPFALRVVDPGQVSARMAASALEITQTLSTWPQLAGDVLLGGATVAAAVRRLLLESRPLPSGRTRVDLDAHLDALSTPHASPELPAAEEPAGSASPAAPIEAIYQAAVRAPSLGNLQPWTLSHSADAVTVALDPARTTLSDVAHRASAVAVGAALFNAQVAAASHGVLGPVTISADPATGLPIASLTLGDSCVPEFAALYPAVLARQTNRRFGDAGDLPLGTATLLNEAAAAEGATMHLLTDRSAIASAAELLGAAERLRYLTPPLHDELKTQIRRPGASDDGIDVRELGLAPVELPMLDLLGRADVMELLRDWDLGSALGLGLGSRVLSSSAVAVLSVPGESLIDYARGGVALGRVWSVASSLGLAVHPLSPPFLYARALEELRDVSQRYSSVLGQIGTQFHRLAGVPDASSAVIVLRLSNSAPPEMRSSRRPHTALADR